MRQNDVFIITLRQKKRCHYNDLATKKRCLYDDLATKNDVFIVIVRHTPAFAFVHRFAIGTATGSSFSPLREGMGYRITLIINRAPLRHPLSERGAAKRRGVSHRQASQ